MTISLDWLPDVAFAYMLLFTRIGAILMLMPALGEDMIPVVRFVDYDIVTR